jgi:hypothetical protein
MLARRLLGISSGVPLLIYSSVRDKGDIYNRLRVVTLDTFFLLYLDRKALILSNG